MASAPPIMNTISNIENLNTNLEDCFCEVIKLKPLLRIEVKSVPVDGSNKSAGNNNQ